MSESQVKRRRREQGPSSDNGHKPEAAPAAAEPMRLEHPAVIVMRVPGDQPGQERIEMVEMNGIDPLSVPTTLRLAAKIRQQQLGVND